MSDDCSSEKYCSKKTATNSVSLSNNEKEPNVQKNDKLDDFNSQEEQKENEEEAAEKV